MKKTLCLALAITTIFNFAATVNASKNSIPVISAETETCPDYEHIHEDDFIMTADDYSAIPCAEVHCSKGSKIGKLIGSTGNVKVGSQNRPCAHGRVGGKDIRYQYQKKAKYVCSLCSYTYTANGTAYWGNWICN